MRTAVGGPRDGAKLATPGTTGSGGEPQEYGESTDTTRSCRASRRWDRRFKPEKQKTRTVRSGSIRCLTTSQFFSALGGT
jgi:hypothetical protein